MKVLQVDLIKYTRSMSINLEINQRCSELTRSLEIDPCGTAINASLFLAVDVPLPWPKPVFNHQLLIGVEELLSNHSFPVRLVASVPENNNDLTLTAYMLDEGSLNRQQWAFNAPDLSALLERVLEGETIDGFKEVPQEKQKRELWICTQGSHDVCCGSEGTSLAVEANKYLPEVEIRRVSHLGGHRFAPTAITFPEGRMWSHLNMEDLQTIFSVSSIEEKLVKKCRGWCGSKTGAEQVAEREGLKLYGRNWDRYMRKSEIISEENSEIRVQVDGLHPESKVRVGFEVVLEEVEKTPVLSCDKAGSIPNKWQTQYEIKKVNVHS